MTYRQLKERIESMPQEWLDKEVQAIGSCMPPTSIFFKKIDDDILQYYDKHEEQEWQFHEGNPLWYKKDLSERHLKNGNYRTVAKKDEYFIVLDD